MQMETPYQALAILRQYHDRDVQEYIIQELRQMKYFPCPSFLGNFQFRRFSRLERLDSLVGDLILGLTNLVPYQEFNTAFVQYYPDNSFVARHRDPRNNVGKTIIATFGNYHGAISDHDGYKYFARSGDVVIQDCTVNGKQGAYHSVDTIKGERYAIILNTIL